MILRMVGKHLRNDLKDVLPEGCVYGHQDGKGDSRDQQQSGGGAAERAEKGLSFLKAASLAQKTVHVLLKLRGNRTGRELLLLRKRIKP